MRIVLYFGKLLIAALTVATVAEVSRRFPRVGALLLSLPLVSLLAILMSWTQNRDLPSISKLARETLILVPLGLPFFVPLAFATRLGLDFWTAFMAGLLLATVTITTWLVLSPA